MNKLIIAFLLLTNIQTGFALTVDGSSFKEFVSVEFVAEQGSKRKMDDFVKIVKRNPTATIVISMDTDGDGLLEKYFFKPGKDDNCDFTGRDNDCDGLIVVDKETTATAVVNKSAIDRTPQSGLPTGKRQHLLISQDQAGVDSFNGSVFMNSVKESVQSKKIVIRNQYESMEIRFKEPNSFIVNSFRKGWDGTVKGGSKVVEISLIENEKIISTIKIQLQNSKGKIESCDGSHLCGKTDHL